MKRDETMLTIGRELLLAIDGEIDLELAEHEYALEQRTEDWLVMRTRQPELSADLMALLGERGYSLRHLGSARDESFTDVSWRAGYLWHIDVPDDVVDAFDRYVDARGEAHPAPPKTARKFVPGVTSTDPGRRVPTSNYDDAEPLPHPKLDPIVFDTKVDAVADR